MIKLKGIIFRRWKILLIITISITYYLFSFHSTEKKYQILNEIIKDNDFHVERLHERIEKVEFNSELLNEFSLIDKISIFSQFAFQSIFYRFGFKNSFEQNKITYRECDSDHFCSIVKGQFEHIKTKERDGKKVIWIEDIYSFSLPIISSDNKTAMLSIGYSMGPLCGHSETYIFRKNKVHWKLIRKQRNWIS